MLLKLHSSRIFTIDPAIRFSERYDVPAKVWNEVWKRALSEYDTESLCGYLMYKTGKQISLKSMRRWLLLTEIYCKANHIMLMGVRAVHSEFFGEQEQFVLQEVFKNMKFSGTQNSRIVV